MCYRKAGNVSQPWRKSAKKPAIDPTVWCPDTGGELQNPAATAEAKPHPRQLRQYRRWLVLAGLLAALVWLNGPGLRWLAPKVAARFFQQAGIRGSFSLEGSLTGGISVRDLRLESDATLAALTVDRVTPDYQLGNLVKGRIQGIGIDGVRADLRLGAAGGKPATAGKKPLDLGKLVRTLKSVREQVHPLAIELKNLSLNATRDGKPVIALAASRIHHAAGDSTFTLGLGTITDANGRKWPARESVMVWNADNLTLQRIDPLPGLSVRDLVLQLPESGGPSAETEIRVDDAVFVVAASPGFSSVTVDLREGRLLSEQVAERFALKLPAKTALTSLSANLEGLFPEPTAATGAARILLEDVVAGEWTVPELSLDVELEAAGASLAASGRMSGSGFSLHAEAPITRDGGKFNPGEVRGHFNVSELANLIAGLAARVKAIDAEAAVPPAMVNGDFTLALKDLRPTAADVALLLQPADPKMASPVALKGHWQPDQPIGAGLEIEGLKATAHYRLETSTYDAGMEFDHFNSARIERWLAIVRAHPGGALDLTGKWRGAGVVENAEHRGTLTLVRADWTRESAPPVTVNGGIDYAWPAGFVTKNLRIQSRDQMISADAKLAAGLLELANLRWLDRGTEIAGGSASMPVPENFARWRDTLVHDARPVTISLDSKVLSLALLKDWLPAAAKLDARSTGRVDLRVAGTYAEPAVDVRVEVRNLRSPEQPKLPPADLIVTLAGRDGHLSVEGRATAPDFPAAVMTASMPFRPAAWAENTAAITAEKITARVDLPRIDLARFTSLVSFARKVSGAVTGNVEIAGELGNPVFKGRLDLTGGGLELKDGRYPAVAGIAAAVDLAVDRVTLKNLRATVAGGTLQGGGTLGITRGKPGALDLRLSGDHLPLLRNDLMIVRANADLRLAGTLERAALSGTVGVVDSLFYRDIELLPIGSPFVAPSAAALPKIDARANPAAAMPPPFHDWSLNVLVRTENPFLIRGNLATGSVTGSVRIGGTLGKPAPDGEVKISSLEAALAVQHPEGEKRFAPLYSSHWL